MMGLSLGPATGKLVAEYAGGGALSVKADAFDPERFSQNAGFVSFVASF